MLGLFKKEDSSQQDGSPNKRQAAWGAWVVIAGLAAIVAIFGIAIARFGKAAEVATAVGSVSGVIAAIIGAYFGLRGSSVAQAQAIEMMGAQMGPQGKPPDSGSHAAGSGTTGAGAEAGTETGGGAGASTETGAGAGAGAETAVSPADPSTVTTSAGPPEE